MHAGIVSFYQSYIEALSQHFNGEASITGLYFLIEHKESSVLVLHSNETFYSHEEG